MKIKTEWFVFMKVYNLKRRVEKGQMVFANKCLYQAIEYIKKRLGDTTYGQRTLSTLEVYLIAYAML